MNWTPSQVSNLNLREIFPEVAETGSISPDIWARLEKAPFIPEMAASTQDPVSHAEGDVWTHTKMVMSELVSDTRWRSLPEDRREALFWSSFLHDVAKPKTRVEEDGKVRNPGHSAAGARMARGILWHMDVPWEIREMACSTILFHQAPFWLIERPQERANWYLLSIGMGVSWHDVAIHAEADTRGRICPDQKRMLESIDLFREMAFELGYEFKGPSAFVNDQARVRYFADPDNRSHLDAPPDMTSNDFMVTLLSGIPGCGKTSYREKLAKEQNLPVLSFDDVRTEMKVAPDENQGALIQEVYERARVLLRKKESFIWDATFLTRDVRRKALSLVQAYGARSRIIPIERKASEAMAANRARKEPVPEAIINRMLDKWEFPTLAESHELVVFENKKAKLEPNFRI